MPQLLEVAFQIFDNWDQAKEEERTWCKSRQARAHAKLVAITVSHVLQPQDNPRGPRKFNHPPGDKTSKVECFKYKSTSHWAPDWQKEPLVHAKSANKHVIRSGTVPIPKGEVRGWLLLLRWLCWMIKAAKGFWWLPQWDVYLHCRVLVGPWHSW